jgi:hypothetical protein
MYGDTRIHGQTHHDIKIAAEDYTNYTATASNTHSASASASTSISARPRIVNSTSSSSTVPPLTTVCTITNSPGYRF